MQDSSNDSHLITFVLLIFAGMAMVYQSFSHSYALESLKAEAREIKAEHSECRATVQAMERTLLMRR
jgi:putative Mn2+ efflux pump MntP